MKTQNIEELPKAEADILNVIACHLMDLDPLLRSVYYVKMSGVAPRPPALAGRICSVCLKRRKIEFIHITLNNNTIMARYSWNNRINPARPVPDKPGWVYRAHKTNEGGSWVADIRDPQQFEVWVKDCEQCIKTRIKYLDERRAKRKAAKEITDTH